MGQFFLGLFFAILTVYSSIAHATPPDITSSTIQTKQGFIGKIKVRSLDSPQAAFDLKNMAIGLANHSINGLILDLRGATGEDAEIAYEAVGPFLAGGQLVFRVEPLESTYLPEYCRWTGTTPNYCYWDGLPSMFSNVIPIVVLINEKTSGVPEAVAGALQANNRALIVGNPSQGKGILTVRRKSVHRYKIVLSDGRIYDEKGLQPNIEVKELAAGKDPALSKALETLKAQMSAIASEADEEKAEEEARKRNRPYLFTPSVN